jgi:uncharacterized protein (DUF342 family)
MWFLLQPPGSAEVKEENCDLEHYSTRFSGKYGQTPEKQSRRRAIGLSAIFFIMLLAIRAETLINDILGKRPLEGHFTDSGRGFCPWRQSVTTMDDTVTELKTPDSIKVSKVTGDHPALVVALEPGKANGAVVTQETLQSILREYGAEQWFLDEEQVRRLQAARPSSGGAKSYRIAELKDAQVQVQISDDRKQAKITIVHPYGGESVSVEKVREALNNAHVVHGIIEAKIPELVAFGACKEVLIAEATPPTLGTEAGFEQLVQESDHKGRPQLKEHGNVDHHDLGLYVSTVKGTPLLRRIPPIPGNPGIGVDSSPIPPKSCREQNLVAGPGTAISPDDPNLLIAAVDGQPIFHENSAKVVGKLELDGVGYHTGDIRFDGSVHIAGPIQPGFKVHAGGDIVALDTVDASNLTAGGSIQLRCGVIGRGRSQISAKGNIRAKFLNECFVICSGNLEIEDLIANCTVVCEGKVEVGHRGGKGQIYGGKVLATKGIRAQILGAITERETFIEISPSPKLTAREREIKNEIKDIKTKFNDLALSLTYLKNSTTRQKDPRLGRLMKDYQALKTRLEALQEELAEITPKLQVHSEAKITASRAHPGVTVSISRLRKVIDSPVDFFVFEPPKE